MNNAHPRYDSGGGGVMRGLRSDLWRLRFRWPGSCYVIGTWSGKWGEGGIETTCSIDPKWRNQEILQSKIYNIYKI